MSEHREDWGTGAPFERQLTNLVPPRDLREGRSTPERACKEITRLRARVAELEGFAERVVWARERLRLAAKARNVSPVDARVAANHLSDLLDALASQQGGGG